MRLVFDRNGWDDYTHWQVEDRAVAKRLNRIITDTLRSPFDGIGKPEPLRYELAGTWSRRVTDEHRLVYIVDGDDLIIVAARYHY